MANLISVGGADVVLPKKKKPELVKILSESDILNTVNVLVEHVSLLSGHNRDGFEAAVTYKDLLSSGFTVGSLSTGISVTPPVAAPVLPNLTVPPEVAGITLSKTFNFNTFFWDAATYSNHSYVEIYRAAAWQDDAKTVPTNVGDAYFLTASPTTGYSDKILPLDEMRYWLRNVSDTGVRGAFSQDFLAITPPNPSYLIDIISGEITKSDLYIDLGTEITNATDGVSDLYEITSTTDGVVASHTTTLGLYGDAIQENATLSADNAGAISAAYTVKIDVGGYVSGFGLMNDGSSSQFVIRADRFSISPPLGDANDELEFVPFIVDGANVLIKNAFIDSAYINTIVATQIDADYINAMDLNAVTISGGTIEIGNDFSVDDDGIMRSTDALIYNAVATNLTIKNSNGDTVMASSGAIDNSYINGLGVLATRDSITANYVTDFDDEVTTVIDSAYINTLFSSTIFAGDIYADNIEGDVTDSAIKNLSSFSSIIDVGSRQILTFTVTSGMYDTFTRRVTVGSMAVHGLGSYDEGGSNTLNLHVFFRLYKDNVLVDSYDIYTSAAIAGSIRITAMSLPLNSSVASGETANFKVEISTILTGGVSGSVYTNDDSVLIQTFKQGSTIS